jgi:hypothetical protein
MSRWIKAAIVLAVTAVTCLCAIFLLGSEEHALPRPESDEVTSANPPAVVDTLATNAPPMVRVEAEPQFSGRHPGLAGGWIRGRVVDGVRGEPIVGADLRLVSLNTGSKPPLSTTVRSADDGRFAFVVGFRGAERLEVRAPGREMRLLRVDGDGLIPQLDMGDVPLYPAKASRLWVVDPSGSPVVGASVFCRLLVQVVLWGDAALYAGEGSGMVFELANPAATTGEDGTAVLPQLTFGTHRLLVVRDGFRCHMHDVQVRHDVMQDVGTVTLDPADAVEITLAREDGGVVQEAEVDLELSAEDSLKIAVQGAKVRLAPPPGGELRVSASTQDAEGSYWGSLEGPGDSVVPLRLKAPGVRVTWPRGSADESMTLWCFAAQSGALWEQARAFRASRDGSWHCWPRRGPEVRFVAWSPRMGLGTASATVPRLGATRERQAAKADPLLAWRQLPRRALRIVAGDAPAARALVVGSVELTDDVVGARIGGTQRPSAEFTCISGDDGVADLGAAGGLPVSARVTLAGHPPVEVKLAADAPAVTTVRLDRGGEVVVELAQTPLLAQGLRVGVHPRGGAPRWFPVSGLATRLRGLALGPADVVLELPAEAGWSLEPPVFAVGAVDRPLAGLELDRVPVMVGATTVHVDLSRVRGPQAELSVVAPRALRVAVTPIGARGLPKQRAFVGMRASAVTRVCGLFDGPWVVELLDNDLRPVWWQEVDVVRAQTDLVASVPASTAFAEGGPADAAGLLSAQSRDGRLLPWLQFPVRLAGGTASTSLPDGTYRADLQSSAGPWRGVARVGGQRLVLTAMPR